MSGVLRYDRGTLLLEGTPAPPALPSVFRWDARVEAWRAPAYRYFEVASELRGQLQANRAPQYRRLALDYTPPYALHPHQREALAAWKQNRGRGLVELPTGAGKTALGLLALSWAGRSALVVVPTRVLMHQWYAELRSAFPDLPVGLIGDGEHEVFDLAVATYDSAAIHAEGLGNRYGCLILDEVHHLPTDLYSPIATYSLAPYRLGLTASLERSDGRQELLYEYVGPLVYRKEAAELKGSVLADYRIEEVRVALSPAERAAYRQALEVRNAFVQAQGIDLGTLAGWAEFVRRSSRSESGRRAMRAHREAARIATAAPAKLRALEVILTRHSGQKTLIFTKENDLAYQVSQAFLLPCITHQTPIKERQALLEGFASGRYLAIVSSNVMNEGINLPDAAVAVNLSGSAVEREFIQRLGRVLRRSGDKRAVLYEIFTEATREQRASLQRRGLERPAHPVSPLPSRPLSWEDLGEG